MNITKLSVKNMLSKPLSTSMSLILLTLGVGMISLLIQINHHIEEQMKKNVRGIDMVVGAKGSPLQLILSAVFHMDAPTGNISMHEAEELIKHPLIKSGIPLSYGDSYQGYRIVGTDRQYPELYGAQLQEGRLWQEAFEVSLGATVAETLDLGIGDTFAGAHGLAEGGETHEGHLYEVVGIFGYTNSVLDQLILTATESVWDVHHHEEEAHQETEEAGHDHEEEHEQEKEITAMLINFRNPMGMIQMPRRVNEDTQMQAALPAFEINRLFSLMGVGIDTLNMIALVIMGVSGISVFISLYSALKDRQYEMALMRAYGASRGQLLFVVLQEGLLLSLLGFVLGMLFSRVGLLLVSAFMQEAYHYRFSGASLMAAEWWLLLVAMGIGLIASIIPAWQASSINISKTLSHAH
ncbi:putative ABC transport system permease protein [Catalinimonas alkaloidigena]|uniref:ABC transporter permease n=1 Tax=Catalinimonas alkaloidigena TaxID=1075417 RepID=UPI002405A42B|nr:ABC transporter permease [Catalinimonas alkaloidigena]MDF9800835.1 putative ABC transport system permease protein [Catalinimonas alkaloidigena]